MRRKISNVEQHFLTENKNQPLEVLARDLGWTEKQVEEALSKIEEQISTGELKPSIKPGKMFARRKGVVGMTPAESQVSDEFSKFYSSSDLAKTRECIHKPLGEKNES